jgi:hypothetical protein
MLVARFPVARHPRLPVRRVLLVMTPETYIGTSKSLLSPGRPRS